MWMKLNSKPCCLLCLCASDTNQLRVEHSEPVITCTIINGWSWKNICNILAVHYWFINVNMADYQGNGNCLIFAFLIPEQSVKIQLCSSFLIQGAECPGPGVGVSVSLASATAAKDGQPWGSESSRATLPVILGAAGCASQWEWRLGARLLQRPGRSRALRHSGWSYSQCHLTAWLPKVCAYVCAIPENTIMILWHET